MTKQTYVYLLEEPKHGIDVSTAKAFGNIKTLFNSDSRRPSVFKPNEFGAAVIRELESQGFDPEVDSFLLTGSLVCISVALGCIMTVWPRVNLLLFSSIEGRYLCRPFDALEMTSLKDSVAPSRN